MQFFKRHIPESLLVLIVCIPLVIWLGSDGVGSVTRNPGVFVSSLGKASALLGMSLFLMMPVLSIRHAAITRYFGGFSKAHAMHVKGGKICFFLIAGHPVLLGLGRLMRGTPFGTIWDWSSLLVISGILAFMVFATAVGFSIYSHIKHQQWLLVHHFFGWLIPLYFVHGLLARNKLLNNKGLFWYFIILGVGGFGAFLYRAVFARYLIRRYSYEVGEINRLTDEVMEVVLRPIGPQMLFQPGQFAYASFVFPGVDPEAHPFSFSNSNNGPYVRFTIKTLGDDTATLRDITPGTKAFLEGPYGDFSYKNTRNTSQVWIAGGIGITPFLSMARSISEREHYDIRFYYGTDSFEEAVFLQEFLDITRHLPERFHTTVVSKEISGFVTLDLLRHSLGRLEVFDYFICGPPIMMKTLTRQLIMEGVPPEQIHAEPFSMR